MKPTFCTCGEAEPHSIAKRRTADGKDVVLWSDGSITGAFGSRLQGVPMRRPRTMQAAQHARRAGKLFVDEICIHDYAELGALYEAAERAARDDGLPGTMRRLLRERSERAFAPTLSWEVTDTDRNGRPTERMARLPRLRWPGLYVLDFCGGPGSARGRYQIWRAARGTAMGSRARAALFPTGIAFRRLADLWAHLEGERVDHGPSREATPC